MTLLSCLLIHPLPVDHVIETVFFTWKVDHTFRMDSTICLHDTPGCCGIDSQINGKDPISKFILILNQFSDFLKCKTDLISAADFIYDRRQHLSRFAKTTDLFRIRRTDLEIIPVPCFSVIQLQSNLAICQTGHLPFLIVKRQFITGWNIKLWFRSTFHRWSLFPVLMVRTIRFYHSKCIRYDRSSGITRHLWKSEIKLRILRCCCFCPMYQRIDQPFSQF